MKLTKAQEKLLNEIRESYDEELKSSKEYYKMQLSESDDERLTLMYKEMLAELADGFITLRSVNYKTLEALAKEGYIEYIKGSRTGLYTFDLVKLLEK